MKYCISKMAGIISAFHEAGRKNFLIDMDATMWILSTEGMEGQNKQKYPAIQPQPPSHTTRRTRNAPGNYIDMKTLCRYNQNQKSEGKIP